MPTNPFEEGGRIFRRNPPRRARLYGRFPFGEHEHQRRDDLNRRQQPLSLPKPGSLEADLDEIIGQSVISFDEENDDPRFVGALRSACRDLAYQLILTRLELQNIRNIRPETCPQTIECPIDTRFGSGPMSIDVPTLGAFLTTEPISLELPEAPEMSVVGTPILDSFLTSIAELVKNRDGSKLQDFLQIEPPVPEIYERMVLELKAHYPSGQGDTELFKRCEAAAPRTKGGTPWTAFATFMKLYFSFIRDVNVGNLLETYNLLKGLVK